MPRCAHDECRRWRPELIVRCAGTGVRVDDQWYCSSACVAAVAAERLRDARLRSPAVSASMPRLRVGTLLKHQGSVTAAQLAEALETQKRSGLKLGAELRRLGYVSAEDVLRALAAQAGVSYLTTIDPVAMEGAPRPLSAAEVQALGVVPIRADEERRLLVVACAAPVPHASLGALRALLGWTPVPFLVSDEDIELLEQLYGAASVSISVTSATVNSIRDAARRIAATASKARAITLAEAQVAPFTWVRVASHIGIDSLLVPNGSRFEEEQECQAATTRH